MIAVRICVCAAFILAMIAGCSSGDSAGDSKKDTSTTADVDVSTADGAEEIVAKVDAADGSKPDICSPDCPFESLGQCGYDDGCGGTCNCPEDLKCTDLTDVLGYYKCLPSCEDACGNPQETLWRWEQEPGPACGELELFQPSIVCQCGACDDGNPCTTDDCVWKEDLNGRVCFYVTDDTNECDDGDPATTAACVDGECVSCTPDCTDKECGDDGCGGSCGECSDGTECMPDIDAGVAVLQCYETCPTHCLYNLAECGDIFVIGPLEEDGCDCGECEEGFECVAIGDEDQQAHVCEPVDE